MSDAVLEAVLRRDRIIILAIVTALLACRRHGHGRHGHDRLQDDSGGHRDHGVGRRALALVRVCDRVRHVVVMMIRMMTPFGDGGVVRARGDVAGGRLGGRRTIPARRPYIPANLISTACLATADEVIE
jgi:hypothetical protein